MTPRITGPRTAAVERSQQNIRLVRPSIIGVVFESPLASGKAVLRSKVGGVFLKRTGLNAPLVGRFSQRGINSLRTPVPPPLSYELHADPTLTLCPGRAHR